MNDMLLYIDDVRVHGHSGQSILEVARAAGLGERIPTLCQIAGSTPQGSCRLCVVEVEGHDRPAAACATLAGNGMRIKTASEAIETMRRELLRLLRDAHPGAAGIANGKGGRSSNHFGQLLVRYNLVEPDAVDHDLTAQGLLVEHPYLRFDPQACIVCRRCLQICEDVQGQFVFSIGGRGGDTGLFFGQQENFVDSPCVSCGACVESCPTGALFDVDRDGSSSAAKSEITRSVCGYCGVGCGVDIVADGSTVSRIEGAADSPVNAGHLCAKGRYAHGWARTGDRLSRPLRREGDTWHEISWNEALAWAAQRLREIAVAHGPNSLGVLTSSRSTNEAAYLLQKLFRALLGTNNVDCCARVCHSSTALALSMATGTGAASASYADIEKARIIVLAGANPTEAHPVIGARIKQATRRGARLIVIDPRVIELCDYAAIHLQLEPGTNVALFNSLAKVLIQEGLVDEHYVRDRTEGYAALRELCAGMDLEQAANDCGLGVGAIEEAARLLGGQGPVLFVTGLGLSELTQGTDSVLALTNIAMLTGSIGRPGGGMLPLRGQNNVQGNADMGSAPGLLTGYQPIGDPGVRSRFEAIWGRPLPDTPGLTIPEMLAEARAGRIHGLWIQGEDIVQSDPNEALVREAVDKLDLLIVQELFFTETARYAHLILPAAGVLEQEGTFTNGERRIQRVRPAVAPPGDARPDWEVVRDLARELGADWQYPNAGSVMEEIARVCPALFGGVSYARLGAGGLQWPCPNAMHPGSDRVHETEFVRGKGLFFAMDPLPSPELRAPQWPYLLITGRVLQQYNVGTMTRRTPNLQLAGHDQLVMHPDDAYREGLRHGQDVSVTSRYGQAATTLRISDTIRPGTLFLSFHFPDTHTNALTSGLVDPKSKCPDYKVTAVRVDAATGAGAARSGP